MRSDISTNPRKLPTQDRSKETVEAILQATAIVLKREGYDRASTRRVAEVAGVSVGSLYQYFPNKESLVVALYNLHVRVEVRGICEDALARGCPRISRGFAAAAHRRPGTAPGSGRADPQERAARSGGCSGKEDSGDVSSLPRRARGGDPSRKPRPRGVHGHRGGRSHNPRRSPRPPRISRSRGLRRGDLHPSPLLPLA